MDGSAAFKKQKYINAAVSITAEMTAAAKKFASVIIYGIGNEYNIAHSEALAFFERLASTVLENDCNKLVGFAKLYGKLEI